MRDTFFNRSTDLQALMAAVDSAMTQVEASGGDIEDILQDAGVNAASEAMRRRGGIAVLADTTAEDRCAA